MICKYAEYTRFDLNEAGDTLFEFAWWCLLHIVGGGLLHRLGVCSKEGGIYCDGEWIRLEGSNHDVLGQQTDFITTSTQAL